jgi:hypothetical protein
MITCTNGLLFATHFLRASDYVVLPCVRFVFEIRGK